MINQFLLNLNTDKPEQIKDQAIEIDYLPCISKIRLIGGWRTEDGKQKLEDLNLSSEEEKNGT
jgi:hypothetical protein